MKYFIIEGTLKNSDLINQQRLQEHMAYTQKAMDQGRILFSGLKENNSGGIFVMKADSRIDIDDYLDLEPFHKYGIQSYHITEFTPHYVNATPNQWFEK